MGFLDVLVKAAACKAVGGPTSCHSLKARIENITQALQYLTPAPRRGSVELPAH
jgi:hypothetical protein